MTRNYTYICLRSIIGHVFFKPFSASKARNIKKKKKIISYSIVDSTTGITWMNMNWFQSEAGAYITSPASVSAV